MDIPSLRSLITIPLTSHSKWMWRHNHYYYYTTTATFLPQKPPSFTDFGAFTYTFNNLST